MTRDVHQLAQGLMYTSSSCPIMTPSRFVTIFQAATVVSSAKSNSTQNDSWRRNISKINFLDRVMSPFEVPCMIGQAASIETPDRGPYPLSAGSAPTQATGGSGQSYVHSCVTGTACGVVASRAWRTFVPPCGLRRHAIISMTTDAENTYRELKSTVSNITHAALSTNHAILA